MKSLNFTTGFYPRRLDTHTWDQEALQESIMAWALSQVPYTDYTVPTVVQGVNITGTSPIQVSAGWVLWQTGGVLKLLRVEARSVSVSAENSMSLQLQTAYGGTVNGIAYPASVETKETPPGQGEPYKDEYLLPVAGATPGGTFFVLETLRYGGAPLGETRFLRRTSAEMTALGFDMSSSPPAFGKGSGFYNGWQVEGGAGMAGRALIVAGTGYTSGTDYGSFTHTLTPNELPEILDNRANGFNKVLRQSRVGDSGTTPTGFDSTNAGTELDIKDFSSIVALGGQAHNNLTASRAAYLITKVR